MKDRKIKSWESEIYLISPSISEKRLLIASLFYYSNMDTVMINDREVQLAITGSENETAEDADNIFDHIMGMNTVEMYGDIDSAFRRVKNDKIENTLSLQLRSIKDIRATIDNSICGRLKIIGITDIDGSAMLTKGKLTRTIVIMLDAKKIIEHDNSDLNFYMDALRAFLTKSSALAAVTVIGRTEEYFHVYPEGSELDLIIKARNLYPTMFELIDNPTGYAQGVIIHREAAYAAANIDYSKLYVENGYLSDNIEYMPWGIPELFRKLVYCSAYVDLTKINQVLKKNENTLLRRIGKFQHGNVRAHINVAEARKTMSRYLIYRYPLDNSIKYFADTL